MVRAMRSLRLSIFAMMLASAGACVVKSGPAPGTTVPRGEGPAPAPTMAVIEGTVTDADTGQPIERAGVEVVRPDHTVASTSATDAGGHYRSDPVPPGPYIIRFKRKAHHGINMPVTLEAGVTKIDGPMKPGSPETE